MINEVKRIVIQDEEKDIKELKEILEPMYNKLEKLYSDLFLKYEQKSQNNKEFNEKSRISRIFNANQYNKNLKKLDEQISSLEETIKKIELDKIGYETTLWSKEETITDLENVTTLEKMDHTFKSAIKLLKSRGETIILTEDEKQFSEEKNEENSLNFENLYLVKSLEEAPKDNLILPDDKNQENYNVRFVVNSEDLNLDDSNPASYVAIIPFTDIYKRTVLSAEPTNAIIRGDVYLTPKCFIVCPKDKGKELEKNNSEVTVIEYEGDVKGYAETIISNLGGKILTRDENGNIKEQDENEYRKIMIEKGFKIEEKQEKNQEENNGITVPELGEQTIGEQGDTTYIEETEAQLDVEELKTIGNYIADSYWNQENKKIKDLGEKGDN